MQILVDTAEQLPYEFNGIASAAQKRRLDYTVTRTNLWTGDYLVDRKRTWPFEFSTEPQWDRKDLDYIAVIERKSLADLYGSVGCNRERFEDCIVRMSRYGFAALAIEAEWSQVLAPNVHLIHETKMTPKSMMASLLAWQQRFGIHICCFPGRDAAERMTFRMLERWWVDR